MPQTSLSAISPVVRRRVRKLFGISLLVLTAQYVLLFITGEPYPALRLPGFAGTGFIDQKVTLPRITIEFLSDGKIVATCPHYELLEGVPDSHHLGIARNVLSPRAENSIQEDSDSWTKQLFFQVFPGFHNARRDHRAGRISDSLRVWLKRRSLVLAPQSDIHQVTICWDAVTYDMSQMPPTIIQVESDGQLDISIRDTSDVPTRVALH